MTVSTTCFQIKIMFILKEWVVGWCDGVGASYNLDQSRARAYCACSRCGLDSMDFFTLDYPFSPLSLSLWETVRYRLKYCLKGSLNSPHPPPPPPPPPPKKKKKKKKNILKAINSKFKASYYKQNLTLVVISCDF